MDDVTLGKLLTEAHRGQADYCEPEGMSVSQSSSSAVFDGSGKPDGERNVDQSVGFGITRNTYSAHSKFSENTQTEKMVDGSGKPDERDSSSAQIRTLLEEQRQMIIAEYREKVGHHELQAAHAEEERRLLREELWRQKLEFREVHQQSLTEMEELRKFQSSAFDTIARGPEHYFGIIRQSTGSGMLNQFAVEIPTLPVDQCHSHLIRYLKGGILSYRRAAKKGRQAFGTHMVYRETFLHIHLHLHQLLVLKN